MPAATIMIQGTTSSAGKSVLCAGLCRLFHQEGFRVAPFKSQNMSTKSAITADGGEISVSQAFQALACGIQPSADMNPVLLKPLGDMTSEAILAGKSVGVIHAAEYRYRHLGAALGCIERSYRRLAAEYDIVVIEGAGSPAEVNLKDRDICNMRIARMADAPVLLVANIDPGGALAAIVGTLELLDADERDRVKGLVINKFRGDFSLLAPGLDFLEKKTGKPVLGVIPYIDNLAIAEEDSLGGKRGISLGAISTLDAECDRIAAAVRKAIDIDELFGIMGL